VIGWRRYLLPVKEAAVKKILGIVVLLSLLLGLVPASAMAAVAPPQTAAPAVSAPAVVATPPAPTPWPGVGATLEVWPDELSVPLEFEGNAYTSIQSAINTASPGDTVLVHPGTYDEFINIDKSLQVISETGAADTIIYPVAPPVEPPTAGVADIAEVQGEVVLISAEAVIFNGFTVEINGYVDATALLPDTGIAVATIEEVSVGETTTPTATLPEVQVSANTVNIDNIA